MAYQVAARLRTCPCIKAEQGNWGGAEGRWGQEWEERIKGKKKLRFLFIFLVLKIDFFLAVHSDMASPPSTSPSHSHMPSNLELPTSISH